MSRGRSTLRYSKARSVLTLATLAACSLPVRAQPSAEHATQFAGGPVIPLGSDLLLQGRPAEGLYVLQTGYRNSSLLDVDTVVFFGAGASDTADVLTINVGFHEPHGYGDARVGRLLLATGAVRPVQLDGGLLRVRPISGSVIEVFGGAPVVPQFGPRSADWIAGARLGQRLLHDRVALGASYVQRRDGGALAAEEIGVDLGLSPWPWLTVSGIGAYSTIFDRLAEARVSARAGWGDAAVELFATQRAAALLLPATSLFSVISNTATREAGIDGNWRLFPRLDAGCTLALGTLGTAEGYRIAAHTRLRLRDDGAGDISIEANRRHLDGLGFSSVLIATQLPVGRALRAYGSLELVAADQSSDGDSLWPWARVGASYLASAALLLSSAVGLRSSSQYKHEFNALLRISYNLAVGVP